MKVFIANDHRGVKLKNYILKYLNSKNILVENFGTDETKSVDYPIIAFKLGECVAKDSNSLGILICGTGIGMSIAANKVKGIRCAKVSNLKETRLSRQHNNANVIALSAELSNFRTKKIIDEFLNTPFSDELRHKNRIQLIEYYESNKNA